MSTDPKAQLPSVRPRIRKVLISPAPATVLPPAIVSSDDAVGYKKPPKSKQFKPGQSGNPKGRPKNAKGMNTIVRDLLTEKVTVRTSAGPRRMSKMEAALHKLTEKGFSGDTRALGALVQLYRASVPDDIARTPANDLGEHQTRTEQDESALSALRDLIRDELLGSGDGDA